MPVQSIQSIVAHRQALLNSGSLEPIHEEEASGAPEGLQSRSRSMAGGALRRPVMHQLHPGMQLYIAYVSSEEKMREVERDGLSADKQIRRADVPEGEVALYPMAAKMHHRTSYPVFVAAAGQQDMVPCNGGDQAYALRGAVPTIADGPQGSAACFTLRQLFARTESEGAAISGPSAFLNANRQAGEAEYSNDGARDALTERVKNLWRSEYGREYGKYAQQ